MDLGAWIDKRVDRTGSCHIWTKAIKENGYGQSSLNGKSVYAHRIAWIAIHGTIPDGLQVLHRCDNPPCVRIDHLFLGTAADNMRDKLEKGRDRNQKKTSCKNGHEFTPENTYLKPSGARQCRECMRKANRDCYARKRITRGRE